MSGERMALLTGCPGWLGNRLLHFMRNPHPDWPAGREPPRWERLRCLVLPGASVERLRAIAPDVELVEGDIRDRDAVERFVAGAEGATVFHMAGVIHPRRLRELFEINTEGSRNLIAAAAAAGARRIVATSSNSPAGVARDPATRFDESSPARPYLAYGRSKQLMEDDLGSAQRGGAIETVIVRPCWFYGPEQPQRQTLFFRMVKQGKAPIVGGGENRRSMSYVDNSALGMLLAAEVPDAAGETYWLADQRPYSMTEVIDTIEQVLERDFGLDVAHSRLRLPALAGEAAFVVDWGLQGLGLYNQRVHVLGELGRTIACSIDKARMQLGYEPGVTLREGMRRSVQWCLESGVEI